jgi:4-amino-4-deoxy-L-arabinose transferase-like glycosyltransferase
MSTAVLDDSRWKARIGVPLVLWGGLALLLAVRLVALRYNATDLFFDEAQYWYWSLEPAFGYYSKPPLIAWIIGAATSVCGTSEFCIRLPSPLIHTATALVIYGIGRRLYGQSTGVWAALAFATLPGISVSAGIISTDVPLLFCWALALLGFIGLGETRAWWPAAVLGIGIGLGLNAKYAMAFFGLSMLVYFIMTPAARGRLRDVRLYAALGLGAVLIAPNLLWNVSNSFATFSHTADNANWGGSLFNIGKGLEFVGAQFGVFGPVLFAALLSTSWTAWRERLPEPDRLLLAFTLPVLVAVTLQAFVSRAHANWAATAYVAGTVLVVAVLLRRSARGWLNGSFAVHTAIVATVGLAVWQAGQFKLPFGADPFARTLGWKALANEVHQTLNAARQQGRPFGTVITDDRSVTAELLYYMRHDQTPVLAWWQGGRPHDHFELTRPFKAGAAEPVLLISIRRDASPVTERFDKVVPLGERAIPAGLTEVRKVRLFALSDFKPR